MSKQRALCAILVLVLGGGCTAVLGIDKDYHSGDSSQTGGGASASGPCKARGAEDCYDGIDNDCNGATDCEDPACVETGFVCVPAIQDGWNPVRYSETPEIYCPVKTFDFIVVSDDSNCTCNCKQTSPPSCTQGVITIASANGSFSPCPESPNSTFSANDGKCGPINFMSAKTNKVHIDPLPATQGTCSVDMSSTMPPSVVHVNACVEDKAGAGCPGRGACVLRTQAPEVSCIARPKGPDQTEPFPCPSGYPNRYVVGTEVVADTRQCGPCSCKTTATCTDAKLTLFMDSACGSGAHILPATGMCESVPDGQGRTYNSGKYSAVIKDADCKPTQNTMGMGSLTLKNEATYCCR